MAEGVRSMRLLAFVGFLALVALVGAGGFFLGGYYNVGGVDPDNAYVARALAAVRMASVQKRAPASAPVKIDDTSVIEAGAKAYAARGCTTCHGAPGAEWAKFSEGLRPDAADLGKIATARSPGEIFWVVKNGINMTGMPSFQRVGASDDEIWRIAAFVKKFPAVSAEDYRKWSTAP